MESLRKVLGAVAIAALTNAACGESDDSGASGGSMSGGSATGGSATGGSMSGGSGGAPGGSGGTAGNAGASGSGGLVSCSPSGPSCMTGFECACGGPGPGQCLCRKTCTRNEDCGSLDLTCGCAPGAEPRVCVDACFCMCD
jgi:hypothetical protein